MTRSRDSRWLLKSRMALGAAGVALVGYGAYRILEEPVLTRPTEVLRWLVAAVVLHDLVLVPFTMLVGAAVTVLVRPARARRYVQGVLVAIAVLTPPVLLEIHRRGSQPAVKALLKQDYAVHLAWVAVAIAVLAMIAYLVRRWRDHRASRTKVRPSKFQDPA